VAVRIFIYHWLGGFTWAEAGMEEGWPEEEARRVDVWVKAVAKRAREA